MCCFSRFVQSEKLVWRNGLPPQQWMASSIFFFVLGMWSKTPAESRRREAHTLFVFQMPRTKH
jgi:hypothetical protein